MGSTAAQMLLKNLADEETPELIRVDPELIVRESTARASKPPKRSSAAS
jgi:DNA-binding LacI/PurR family transcriptional regulator